MRLGIKLLNSASTLNNLDEVAQVKITKGENPDLLFQLVDLDQKSLRYIPASGATAYVEIPRFPEFFGTSTNTRDTKDFSVRRYASQPFADDKSIWKLSLTSAETSEMMSTNMRVTVTEGSNKKIAVLQMAIVMTEAEG